jgi:hypothetical protein
MTASESAEDTGSKGSASARHESQPQEERGQADEPAGSAAIAVRVGVGGLGVLVAVAAVVGRDWIGPRAWLWLPVVLAGAAVVALCWRPWAGRGGAAAAALLAIAAVAVTGAGARRVGSGDLIDTGNHADVTDRVLARDLPPAEVYVMAIAAALMAAVCVLVAWRRDLGWRRGAGGLGRGAAAGSLAVAVLVPGVVASGTAARSIADRWAESDAVDIHRVRPAERLAEAPGPAAPTEEAWRIDGLTPIDLVAVPGWDVVLAYGNDDVSGARWIVALSKTDGSELWRYQRHDASGFVTGLAVDPESGRVLLVVYDAVVVLALDNGEEIAARALPERLRRTHLAGRDPTSVGRTAVVSSSWGSGHILFVVDVASGQTIATMEAPDPGCDFVAVTTTSAPLVVQSGRLDEHEGACDDVTLLGLDDAGQIEPVADIPPPLEDVSLEAVVDDRYTPAIAAGDVVLLSITWATIEGDNYDKYVDLVAVSPDGEVRWRASDTSAGGRALPDDTQLVAVTDQGVVARWARRWRLLSLADGTELASQPVVERYPVRTDVLSEAACDLHRSVGDRFVADTERIYTQCGDRLFVRRIEDLAPLGVTESFPFVTRWYATTGRIIGLERDRGRVWAFGEGPPLQLPSG